MDLAVFALIAVNLVAGTVLAIPLARLLSKMNRRRVKVFRYFTLLILIYFVESVAVGVGMGIPVLCVGLAFGWGIIFGYWIRALTSSAREALKTSAFLSLYSSMPAASFIIVPFLAWIGGRHILSSEEGFRFGIPDFLFLPWPFNTILGFYAALVIGAVVFKTVITMGEVSMLIHLGKSPTVGGS